MLGCSKLEIHRGRWARLYVERPAHHFCRLRIGRIVRANEHWAVCKQHDIHQGLPDALESQPRPLKLLVSQHLPCTGGLGFCALPNACWQAFVAGLHAHAL